VIDLHNEDWLENYDLQVRVGDLILNSRHSGSNDVEADNQRGANGNLGLGAKGLVFFYMQDGPEAFSVKLWIRNDGNVGIGSKISDPHEKLVVDGNIVATGDVQLAGGDCASSFKWTCVTLWILGR